MKESDWKQFKKIKEQALDKFCRDALAEFEALITDKTQSAHQRYLNLYQRVRERDKELARVFDDHSRSKAPLQLGALRMRGLVPEELVGQLSQELQESTNPGHHE